MHDKKGAEIKAGDLVNLRCRVKSVTGGETQCNITVEPVERPEGEEVSEIVTINSRFFEKVEEEQEQPERPTDNVRTDEQLAAERKQKEEANK